MKIFLRSVIVPERNAAKRDENYYQLFRIGIEECRFAKLALGRLKKAGSTA